MRIKRVYFRIFILISIILLTYTAIEKILKFDDFMINLSQTDLFNYKYIETIAFFIIFLELFIVFFLFFKEKVGVYLLFFFFLFSTAYVFILNSEGNYSRCGCGGILNTFSYYQHLLFNVLFIFSSIAYIKKND